MKKKFSKCFPTFPTTSSYFPETVWVWVSRKSFSKTHRDAHHHHFPAIILFLMAIHEAKMVYSIQPPCHMLTHEQQYCIIDRSTLYLCLFIFMHHGMLTTHKSQLPVFLQLHNIEKRHYYIFAITSSIIVTISLPHLQWYFIKIVTRYT